LSFFQRLQRVDLKRFYDEDRVVIETVQIRGLAVFSYSPYLKHVHGPGLRPEATWALIGKILRRVSRLSQGYAPAYDTLEGCQVIFPARVAEGIEITSFGLECGKHYDTEDYSYPVGHSANTDYLGEMTECTVEDSPSGIVFTVSSRQCFRLHCYGDTRVSVACLFPECDTVITGMA
jgi:hypothetical protein